MICHKSQGLRKDFEMLIRLKAVTSLCTSKNTTDLSFMCALESCEASLLPPPSPRLTPNCQDVKDKYEILSCHDGIKSQDHFLLLFFKVHNITDMEQILLL